MANIYNIKNLQHVNVAFPWVTVFMIALEQGYVGKASAVGVFRDPNLEIRSYQKSEKVGYVKDVMREALGYPHVNLEVKGSYVEVFANQDNTLAPKAVDFLANCDRLGHYLEPYDNSDPTHGTRFGYRLTRKALEELSPYAQAKELALALQRLTLWIHYKL